MSQLHRQPQTSLGAYWEIYQQTTWTVYCSLPHEDSITGPWAWGRATSWSKTGTGTRI